MSSEPVKKLQSVKAKENKSWLQYIQDRINQGSKDVFELTESSI